MRELIHDCKIFKIEKEDGRVIVNHPGSVAVLATLTDDVAGIVNIVLVKQKRPVQPDGLVMLEIPAGTQDVIGETPKNCALRELEEETGYRAGKIAHLVTQYPTCGYSTEKMEIYLAEELTLTGSKIEEDLEVVIMDLYDVHEMIRNGQIQDGKTILAIYSLYTFYDDNEPKWESVC